MGNRPPTRSMLVKQHTEVLRRRLDYLTEQIELDPEHPGARRDRQERRALRYALDLFDLERYRLEMDKQRRTPKEEEDQR